MNYCKRQQPDDFVQAIAMRPLTYAYLSAALVLSGCSVRSVTAPAWKIQFVDLGGTPLSGLPVQQSWQNYSVEETGHQQERFTDAEGFVSFPERYAEANLFAYLTGPVGNLLGQGVHASYGPSASFLYSCSLIGAIDGRASFDDDDLPEPRYVLKYYPTRGEPAMWVDRYPACAALHKQVREAEARLGEKS